MPPRTENHVTLPIVELLAVSGPNPNTYRVRATQQVMGKPPGPPRAPGGWYMTMTCYMF